MNSSSFIVVRIRLINLLHRTISVPSIFIISTQCLNTDLCEVWCVVSSWFCELVTLFSLRCSPLYSKRFVFFHGFPSFFIVHFLVFFVTAMGDDENHVSSRRSEDLMRLACDAGLCIRRASWFFVVFRCVLIVFHFPMFFVTALGDDGSYFLAKNQETASVPSLSPTTDSLHGNSGI